MDYYLPENIFFIPPEKLDTKQIKIVLEMFNFDIPENQLPYIEINSIKDFSLNFTNKFTGEKCFAYRSKKSPFYDFSGEKEYYLVQKIELNSKIKMNWFTLRREISK